MPVDGIETNTQNPLFLVTSSYVRPWCAKGRDVWQRAMILSRSRPYLSARLRLGRDDNLDSRTILHKTGFLLVFWRKFHKIVFSFEL